MNIGKINNISFKGVKIVEYGMSDNAKRGAHMLAGKLTDNHIVTSLKKKHDIDIYMYAADKDDKEDGFNVTFMNNDDLVYRSNKFIMPEIKVKCDYMTNGEYKVMKMNGEKEVFNVMEDINFGDCYAKHNAVIKSKIDNKNWFNGYYVWK